MASTEESTKEKMAAKIKEKVSEECKKTRVEEIKKGWNLAKSSKQQAIDLAPLWFTAKVDTLKIGDTKALDWKGIQPDRATTLMQGCLIHAHPRGLGTQVSYWVGINQVTDTLNYMEAQGNNGQK